MHFVSLVASSVLVLGCAGKQSSPSLAAPAATACAQSRASSARFELTVLGSGGPRSFGRAASGYVISIDGAARVLVDVGPGSFVRLGEMGIDFSRLDTVLLTHLHIDHSADLPSFVKSRDLTYHQPLTFHIVGPSGSGIYPSTTAFIERLFGAQGAFAYLPKFRNELTFDVSGDLASKNDNLARLAEGTDLLVYDTAVLEPPGSPAELYDLHTPPKRIGEVAARAGVKALLLSHLPASVEKAQAAVLSAVHSAYQGPTTFASDCLRVDLTK